MTRASNASLAVSLSLRRSDLLQVAEYLSHETERSLRRREVARARDLLASLRNEVLPALRTTRAELEALTGGGF